METTQLVLPLWNFSPQACEWVCDFNCAEVVYINSKTWTFGASGWTLKQKRLSYCLHSGIKRLFAASANGWS